MKFEESKHPRDSDGKFTDGSSDKSSDTNRKDNVFLSQKKKKAPTFEEFFGEEFQGVKGAEAVELLLKEKRGHVKDAFYREEVGGITLVWGNENGGLLHTIQKRDKLFSKWLGNIEGVEMARKIPEIVEQGNFIIDEKDRPCFEYKNYLVAIRPTYDGTKMNWIITAMEIFPK